MAKQLILRIATVTTVELQLAEVEVDTKPNWYGEEAKVVLRRNMSREEEVTEDWRPLSLVERAIYST